MLLFLFHLQVVVLALFVLLSIRQHVRVVEAFSIPLKFDKRHHHHDRSLLLSSSSLSSKGLQSLFWKSKLPPVTELSATTASSTTVQQQTIFSGEPMENAKRLNHRAILSKSYVYQPGTGTKVSLESILSPITTETDTTNPVSIVVFLRSLG
jgi:hypothetical protein